MVRWCLGVVSMPHFLHFTVIWGAGDVSFGVQNVSFGILVASTLAPCGIIERSRGTWDHKKGDLGVQISGDLGSPSFPEAAFGKGDITKYSKQTKYIICNKYYVNIYIR